ncbi:hypothetical protein RU639_012958 [Aspergillus parasiticus]
MLIVRFARIPPPHWLCELIEQVGSRYWTSSRCREIYHIDCWQYSRVSFSFIIVMVGRTPPRVSKSFQGDTVLCSLGGPGSRQNRHVANRGHAPTDQCELVWVLFNCNMNTQEMGLNSPDQSRHLVVDDDCASD